MSPSVSSRLAWAVAAAAAAIAPAGPAAGQTTDRLRRELAGVQVVERLGARVPLDAPFVDDAGAATTLGRYAAAGRPILLSLNYARCPVLCSVQLAGLAEALGELPAADRDVHIVTISIDPTDTPAKLGGAKKVYVRQTGDYAIAERWHFLAGGRAAIDAVADSIGFAYRYDPEADEYRHQATLAVLTPDGRVSSYLHGVTIRADELRAAIARAARGEVLTAEDQQALANPLLNCFAYDSDSASPMAVRAMRIGGVITLVGLVALLAVYVARERNRKRAS
ncbi:MAG: SCO family protein [Deltaproteobacteria bacterium]|nr:MAG: SCO family protein [Deltaproteobacteria bacterium]